MNTFLLCIPLILVLTIGVVSIVCFFATGHYEFQLGSFVVFVFSLIFSFIIAVITNGVYTDNNTKHGIYMECVDKYQFYGEEKSTIDKATVHANCESLIKSI
jgi:hypothetical protein